MKYFRRVTTLVLFVMLAMQMAPFVLGKTTSDCVLTDLSVYNVQLFHGKVFVETNRGILQTGDLQDFAEPLDLSYDGYVSKRMLAFDDIIFFNDGKKYTKDGVTFGSTKLDGDTEHERIWGINYWNGFYFGFAYTDEEYCIVTSHNGEDWSIRIVCGEPYSSGVFILSGTLWLSTYDGGYYGSADGVSFVKSNVPNRIVDKVYDDTFAIAYVSDPEADYDKECTYYVTNDNLTWRVLIKDGVMMRNTEWWSISPDYISFEVLDNALPGERPLLWEDYDPSKMYSSYSSEKPSAETLSARSSGADVTITESASKNADIIVRFESITSWGTHGSLSRSFDGGDHYSYFLGAMFFQDAASNGNGQFIITGARGSMLICTVEKNDDGYHIDKEPYAFNPDNSGIKMIKYENNQYIICTFAGSLYASADGVNWTGMAALAASLNDIVWDGKLYYAAGDNGIFASRDLTSWKRVYKTSESMRAICTSGDKIIACGTSGVLVYSTDGKQWSLASIPDSPRATLYGAAYGNGVYVVAGGTGWGGAGIVLSSTDGVNWVKVHDGYHQEDFEPDTDDDICYQNCTYALKYIDGQFVATGLNRSANGFTMCSRDGRTWEWSGMFYWGLDLVSPLPDIVAYLRTSSLVICDYGTSTVGSHPVTVSGSGDCAMLQPQQMIRPLFEAEEVWSASDKVSGSFFLRPFADVNYESWYAEAVDFCAEKGVVRGVGNNMFSPSTSMSRAMFAQMLANYERVDLTGYTSNPFTDVSDLSAWYHNAVSWAYAVDLVEGKSASLFAPNASVTREEMATLLSRYVSYKGYVLPDFGSSLFSDDSEISDWARVAVYSMFRKGIVNGLPNGCFAPAGFASRAEIAQMFMNFIVRVEVW